MKKIKLLITFCALILLVACKGKDEKSSPDTNASDLVKGSSDRVEANEVIEFNNKFLRQSQDQSNFIRSLESFFSYAGDFIKKDDNQFGISITPSTPAFLSINNKVAIVPKKLGADVESNYKLLLSTFDTIRNDVDEIEKYLKAEDFKDDNGAKYAQLKDKILKASEVYNKVSDDIYNKLVPAADAAEAVILKDHPLKENIISSKKILTDTEKLMAEVIVQTQSQSFNEARIQELYNNTEKALKANIDMKLKGGDEFKHKEISYKNFNEAVDTFLGSVRKEMRTAKETNTISEEFYTRVEGPYNRVVSSYNSFVD